ncbi:hypothetical protein BHE74_00047381 [Ensete ventricosum]|nr:hypothetical protein BHE74_00047381 [Ensete ventricosum]
MYWSASWLIRRPLAIGQYYRLGLFLPRYHSKSIKKREKEKKNLELRCSSPALFVTRGRRIASAIRRPRAKNRQRDPSPTGDFFSLHGEKKRLFAWEKERDDVLMIMMLSRYGQGLQYRIVPLDTLAIGTAKNRSSTIDFDGQRPIEGEKGKKKKKKKKKKKRKRRKKKRKRRKPSAVLAPAPSPPSLARRRRASALACFFSRVRRRNISPRREKRSRQRVVKKARSSFAIAHDFSRSVDESIEVDCELLNLYDRPEKLIVTTIAVPPVAVRPSVFVDFGKSRGSKGSRDAFVVTCQENVLNSLEGL